MWRTSSASSTLTKLTSAALVVEECEKAMRDYQVFSILDTLKDSSSSVSMPPTALSSYAHVLSQSKTVGMLDKMTQERLTLGLIKMGGSFNLLSRCKEHRIKINGAHRICPVFC